MPPVICCPDRQELQRFSLGQLTATEAERIERHLLACGHCLASLEMLSSADLLMDAVRAQAATLAPPENDTVNQLIEQLQRRPPSAVQTTAELAASLPCEEATRAPTTLAASPAEGRGVYDFLAPPQKPDEIGRLGPFRVLEALGAGGMGVVFRAESLELERSVALKVMLPAMAATPSARERFQREARAAAAIEHDHVVTIYQVGQDRGVPFLAMQMLKGESLDNRLRRDGTLPIPEVLRIGRETASGLAAAHSRGLIHRDIKPANLWLEGEGGRIKILDFGLARAAADSSQLTQSGLILGTPAYMAPEQARGREIDARADLFSLGCVLYRCATGRSPFQGKDTLSILAALALDDPPPPRQLNAEVPPALSALIVRLLAKDPADRPPSAQALVAALAALEANRPKAASPRLEATKILDAAPVASSRRRPAPPLETAPLRRRPWWPFALAAGLALAVFAPLGFRYVPTVIRIATNRGQLVIETDDPDVEVRVKRNGEQVTIVDAKTNKEITLQAGAYQLELVDGKEGLTLSTNQFTLNRGGHEVVKVRLEAKAAPPGPEQSEEIRRFTGHTGAVTALAMSADGRRLFSGGADGTLRQWDFATGQEQKKWHLGNRILCIRPMRDGRRLLCGSVQGFVLFDWEAGQELRRYPGGDTWCTDADFSPDEHRFLASGYGNLLTVWDTDASRRMATIATFSRTSHMAASADLRRTLVCNQWNGTAVLYDVAGGKEERRLEGHEAGIEALAFSPDGRRVLTGGKDKTVRLWDVETGRTLACLRGHTEGILSVTFAADGRRVLSGGTDRTARLWDGDTGKEICCLKGHTAEVWVVRFRVDGRQALSAGGDGTVRLWRLPEPLPKKSP